MHLRVDSKNETLQFINSNPFEMVFYIVTRALEKALKIAKIKLNEHGLVVETPLNMHPKSGRKPGKGIDQRMWCWCSEPDDNEMMVECSSKKCHVKWYHAACVNMKCVDDVPHRWFCLFC